MRKDRICSAVGKLRGKSCSGQEWKRIYLCNCGIDKQLEMYLRSCGTVSEISAGIEGKIEDDKTCGQ